ncbi:uncharacterized protein PV07_09778 [Cladophialophora immunda]|uniref:Inosine/uridine-preferring nucleoside hydrolase domain-containing protein n=1 Tax=Cladophialophora immunda TaxID=569365 RepID=A0A0D2CKJ4_9EURO|nr:uncharacterized protein PV07_09778 [Cladophialophora immunda]KIW24039.1 hypothetical protein PV07_09778 [Cladophialophora immunda]
MVSFRKLGLLPLVVTPVIGSPMQLERRNSTDKAPRNKVIIDNDYLAGQWDPYLLALNAGWEVLGLTTCTGNTWMPQQAKHALAMLEYGNLSCIPVYTGALYPLVSTYERFHSWEAVHGDLPWQGAFAPYNATLEAEGWDPSGGSDPYRIVQAAFTEGFPTAAAQSSPGAVQFMIDQVHKYPGQVSIFAAGPMTNVALAIRTDPEFASLAKELVIEGGKIDVNLFQFNLLFDPEAAKIVLNANFPRILVSGNVANSVFATDEWIDEVAADGTAAVSMVDPSIVLNSTTFFIDVDVAYASPNYGNVHAYQKALAPPNLRNITYVLQINETRFKNTLKSIYQKPITCADLS